MLPSKRPRDKWEIIGFRYKHYDLIYPRAYYEFLKEQYYFDIYRSHLLTKGQIVLDLGANIGAFSILASKRVGRDGKVISIEPNILDYNILIENIRRNNCDNVFAINIGVGKRVEEKESTFWDRKFNCRTDTLHNILDGLDFKDRINFVKMDIEGYEIDVLQESIRIFQDAHIISLECHKNKQAVDKLLIPRGFHFYPVTTKYVLKQTIKSTILYPHHFIFACSNTIVRNPSLIYKLVMGYDMNKNHPDNIINHTIRSVVGSYINTRFNSR